MHFHQADETTEKLALFGFRNVQNVQLMLERAW
jgi:hypothetical protein